MSIRRIEGLRHEVGGVPVRRLLPVPGCQGVGPFVYFDHFGPLPADAADGIAVLPHPHIGLVAVTYLFDGRLVHRDSLGTLQVMGPGEVNWLVAGRGVVHSERSETPRGDDASRLHGIQAWLALPREQEACDPAFYHFKTGSLPAWAEDGAAVTLVAGRAYGEQSPVPVPSPLAYLEVKLEQGAELALPADFEQLGVYLVQGAVAAGQVSLRPRTLAVLSTRDPGRRLRASDVSRVMLLGGEPQGRRYLWWNFVASTRDRIERAKADWQQQRFAEIPGEIGRMAMPGEQ